MRTDKFRFLQLMALSNFLALGIAFGGVSTESISQFKDQVLELSSNPALNSDSKKTVFVVLREISIGKFEAALFGSGVSLFGFCVGEHPCIKSGSTGQTYLEQFARSIGYKTIPQMLSQQFSTIQEIPYETTSNVTIVNEDSIEIDLSYKMLGMIQPKMARHLVLKRSNAFRGINFKIGDIQKDEEQRTSLNQALVNERKLANSVFKIDLSKSTDENLLSSATSAHGTGFFVSKDGLFMTNHHVIQDNEKCFLNLECTVKIERTLSNRSTEKTSLKATILALSLSYDFALLKAEIPSGFEFEFLEFENRNIGPELLTLGYPGDRSNFEDGALTVSKGVLAGFNNMTFSTNVYIYGGASGSPVMNASNHKVVGILSNGSGNGNKSMPGIVRPIHLIEQKFQISDYITGTKTSRIKSILSQLSKTSDTLTAKKLLRQHQAENTLFGLRSIEDLMIKSELLGVRVEVQDYLRSISYFGVR